MTNFEMLKTLSIEQMASFLAHERFSLANVVFKKVGYGITEEAIYSVLLKWLNKELE